MRNSNVRVYSLNAITDRFRAQPVPALAVASFQYDPPRLGQDEETACSRF
jgi:hypothetical protein